jgi:hypothetical protein
MEAAMPVPRPTPLTPTARHLYGDTDLADAWRVPVPPGAPTDPALWANILFHADSPLARAVLRLRDALVRPLGIPPVPAQPFATVAADEREVVLAYDDMHVEARVVVAVDDTWATVSTVARARNRAGRVYLTLIRPFHPVAVRRALANAARLLARTG